MKNSILLFLFLVPTFLFAQYPTTGNKARLGYQTTGDGLIWRGVAADTVLKPRVIAHAYFQLDTVNAVLRRYIATKGSWQVVGGGGAEIDSLVYSTIKGLNDSIQAEKQTLSFASPLLGISDGNNVDLSPILTGYVTGSGTANYVPKWSALTNLTNSNLFDNNTYAGVISRPWKFGEWTTAGRPSSVDGYYGKNTTTGFLEGYYTSQWENLITSTGATANQVSYFTSAGQIAGNSRHTINSTTGAQAITFNNSGGGVTWELAATTPLSSRTPFGFRYNNSGTLEFGLLNGSKITFIGGGAQATLSGTWNFPTGAVYPNPLLGATNGSSNDVRLVITKSGNGASQTVYAYTQRFSVANNAPNMFYGANSYAWGTRNTTTPAVNSADSVKAFLAQNGDFWLGNAIYGGLGSFPSITPGARLKIIGRGTATTNLLLDLQNRVGTSRFSVLENGEVRIPVLSATPTRIVGADADGDLGQLTLSGLSISGGVLSSTWLGTALPAGDVQIAANNNSLRLNSLDTMKMNHAIITTPGTTNLLLLNPNVGSTGYPSSLGGGFHTVINGTMATSNAGTGHIVIGGVVNEGLGANFGIALGYSSNIGSNYAVAVGYDADATGTDNSMAIGYGARADESYEITLGSSNYTKLNLWATGTLGRIEAGGYGTGAKEAADLSKTQSNYIAGFATDGTVLDLERKRDTTIYINDSDYDFSTALTTAQIASRYNRIIFLMTTTAAAGSNSELTLHTPDINLMQVEYLIRSTDEVGGFNNVIQFGSNNAVQSDNTLTGTYNPSAGQGVGIRVGLRSGVYKYYYY